MRVLVSSSGVDAAGRSQNFTRISAFRFISFLVNSPVSPALIFTTSYHIIEPVLTFTIVLFWIAHITAEIHPSWSPTLYLIRYRTVAHKYQSCRYAVVVVHQNR